MPEYWLQKKTIGGWSQVTWYSELEQAQHNYNQLRKATGYSYRMVKVETVQEHLLEEVVAVEAPALELAAKSNVWAGNAPPIKKSEPEATQSSNWGNFKSASVHAHGLAGKVWLGNPVTKEKKRIDPGMVDGMMKDGWIKVGPRTVL